MIVDIHCHFVAPVVIEALERNGRQYGAELVVDETGNRRVRFPDGFTTFNPILAALGDLDRRLTQQDDHGIDLQVLSGWNDLVGYTLPGATGQALAELQNDTLAAIVRTAPDRLRAMAKVPLQDAQLAASELRRVASRYGMRAVQIGSHVAGRNLDDPSLDPFWRACQDEGMLVLVHPVQPAAGERLARYGLVNLIGNPFEVWLAGASILLGGVLERFPALTVCLAHGGGGLPYQIGRLDRGFASRAESQAVASVAPRQLLGRLYFDTLIYSEEALRYLLGLVGPERVLFGSDAPFPIAEPKPVASVAERIAYLPTADQALILGGNAARLLGIGQ